MPTFKRRWYSNHWTSDEGYSLEFIGGSPRPFLKHDDGTLVAYVDMRPLAGKDVAYALRKDRVFGGRSDGPPLAEAEAGLVVGRVQAFFDAMGWRLEVLDRPPSQATEDGPDLSRKSRTPPG